VNVKLFRFLTATLGCAFTLAFAALVAPAFIRKPDVLGAFAAGFVNPYSAGYSLDAITCWCLLVVWVIYEARVRRVRHGWVALVLGVVPGVAAGLAVYLLIRLEQDRGQTLPST
jgi:hypothetical protein